MTNEHKPSDDKNSQTMKGHNQPGDKKPEQKGEHKAEHKPEQKGEHKPEQKPGQPAVKR